MAETSRESNGDPRFLFFSSLLGRPVAGPGGEPAGRVTDLVVNTVEPYPPVESLVVRRHGSRLQVPWSAVEMSATGLRLKPGAVLEEPLRERAPDRLPVAEELLDRQIVDVEGAKLVRVNDLHFLEVKGALRLVHVDVGFRGLVRPRAGYLASDQLLSWKLVQPLDSSPGRLRVEVAQRALATLHPADLAEIMEELDRDRRAVLLQRLDVETAADALEEVPPEMTAQLLEEVPPERAADILEEMAPDEAADVLGELSGEARQELLEAMERPEAREVQQLLTYPPDSAGGLMTPDRIQLGPEATVADAIAQIKLRSEEIPLVYEVFVTDRDGVLKGICTLKDLLVNDAVTLLGNLARESPATVEVDASARDVAEAAAKYNLLSVPVVDRVGVLMGMVTVDDILAEVLGAR